jgi:hypothetical protein
MVKSQFELDPREVEDFILCRRASSLSIAWRYAAYAHAAAEVIASSSSAPMRS